MRKAEAGYTLSELLVVLLILSLMSALGPAALNKLVPNVALSSAARMLDSDLELLRSQSILRAAIGELRFENEGRGYIIVIAETVVKRRKLGNGVVLHTNMGSLNSQGHSESVLTAGLDGRLTGHDLFLKRGSRTRHMAINPVFGTIEVTGRNQ